MRVLAAAQLEETCLREAGSEAGRRHSGQVYRRPAHHDPLGQHLAECGRGRQSADATATDNVKTVHARGRPQDVLPIRSHRWQATAVLLYGDVAEDRELAVNALGQAPQHGDVELQILNPERGRLPVHVVLHRVLLVAAQHQPALVRAHVDIRVDDAGDRLVWRDFRQWNGDQQLMACRHNWNARARQASDATQPAPGCVDHGCRAYLSFVGRDAGYGTMLHDDLRDARLRQQPRAQPRACSGIAERHLYGLQVDVGAHVQYGPYAGGVQEGHETPGGLRRDEVDVEAELFAARDFLVYLLLVLRRSGDL